MKKVFGFSALLCLGISLAGCGKSSEDDGRDQPKLKLVDEGLSDELLLSSENLLNCEPGEDGVALECSLPAGGLQFKAGNDDFSEPLFYTFSYSLRCENELGIANFQVRTDLQARRLQYESKDRAISLFGKGPIVLEVLTSEDGVPVASAASKRCYLALELNEARTVVDIYGGS